MSSHHTYRSALLLVPPSTDVATSKRPIMLESINKTVRHMVNPLTTPIFVDALSDPYVQQSQSSYAQEPFIRGRMLHQSNSSAPTTPSLPNSWAQDFWSDPIAIQESRVGVDQAQTSSGSCSNDGNEFQDHAKLLRDAPSLFPGPVEQGPVGVGPWMGESRVPGDRTLYHRLLPKLPYYQAQAAVPKHKC
ncbi:hypothetical protein KC338_g204 [Hortaea werneckii]|nr:hypothetical protein KC338_g204 [Hortaea werneckii]